MTGYAERWREAVGTEAETLAPFRRRGARPRRQRQLLLSCLLARRRRTRQADGASLPKAGLSTIELPAAVRLRRRGDFTFAFNYGETPWPGAFQR